MNWLLPRLVALAVAALVGGAAGGWLPGWNAPGFAALLGVAIALAGIALRDAMNAFRLIAWLRDTRDTTAPRDTGPWGEVAYRIERALRSREREADQERDRLTQFLSAIEASPNGVLLLDAGDQIEWCNSVAADHFGLDPIRDRRQRVTNLLRAPAFVDHLQSGAYGDAVEFPDPSGRFTLSVILRTYGEGLKLVLSQDITERERADAMKRDFVANVSHEIRTPLTVLAGFIETLTDLPLSPAERERVLVLMSQQAQRMGLLVSDLLTLATLEGSPRPQVDRWVPVGPLLAQVALDAGLLSGGRHVLQFPTEVHAHIAGAQSEVLSAVNNLVSNAVRYTPGGGRIAVGWRVLADGTGELAVSDTGPGIAREHLPRLTERFYRVDGSRSRDTGGTGLGLSIVKHVVQRHGGTLDIQSEWGRGSTFRLLFPSARVRTDSVAAPTVDRTQAAVS